MLVGIVGDTHGNTASLCWTLNQMGRKKIQQVVIVGDFGLWTHEMAGHIFLDEVNAAAKHNGLTVYAVGGNHENWDHWNAFLKFAPQHKGFGVVRSRILLAPKVHHWKWDNKVFVGAGGAVSVDKGYRLEMEKRHGPRTLWWPDEELTDQDVESLQKMGNGIKADYLISHDCSDRTPFRGRMKPDLDSQIHRTRIDKVLTALRPDVHFHGHMHTKYDWVNSYPVDGDYHDTQTYGLECDGMNYNYGGYNTCA